MSTIRDVAKHAGVSIASVSRVLNDDRQYKMTDETKLKIEQAIRELDYHPREVKKGASGLPSHIAPSQLLTGRREQKKRTQAKIGCVLRVTRRKFNDPYYMSILSSIESRLSELGYQISFIKTGAELMNPSILTSAITPDVKGLVIMEDLSDETYSYLRSVCPCIVGIDTHRSDIDNVAYDHYEAAGIAVEHLINRGYTKIGYIGGQGEHFTIQSSQRYRGFRYTMETHGLPVEDDWVIDSEWDEELCSRLLDKMCRENNLPQAFFVGSDLMAMATMNVMHAHNISIPSQIAVMGLTDLDITRFSNPPLSTVHVPIEEIGMAAADMLIARIEGYSMAPQKITLSSKLVVRSST